MGAAALVRRPPFAEWWRSSWFCLVFIDCPGGLKAVAIDEISINLLKARKQAFSHLFQFGVH